MLDPSHSHDLILLSVKLQNHAVALFLFYSLDFTRPIVHTTGIEDAVLSYEARASRSVDDQHVVPYRWPSLSRRFPAALD